MNKSENRIKCISQGDKISILYDNNVLFERVKNIGHIWYYITKEGEQTIRQIFRLDENYINLFFEDICSQLDNCVDRNNLKMNIIEKYTNY
jgi:hypothetical protein